ncbi:Pyruvate/2-oxoglutarate dehydrogenase complex, dihydrolipoamide dehydrogenase (E3) component [Dyella jiangningensis]|uniref:FAD-containing oxidoreductase n=1 Tax=Dyella sp. AtDHG13 TaxID=1938897 RepID=UPI000885D09F|nr:FAD-containing oxidoreductase [Dyella sp. AtDHG13]PXV60299.1 pyruvate/2-oxoglutarate dehydrogenase complex dihydrolipoamide dehydrogenase (E3) component [Dyella sp. AtDHG13]SDJ39791.1 Pyruvate/2-oxoglutarate dehydrogenase complex, dihydrolipoamide dehydrogenase (E3) component [Dyella jiangningensis]
MTRSFDAIIVGAGQAGPSLAGRLTAAGMKVALVERHLFGGTCVNTGCMPTKTLVASARVAHQVRRAADYGVVLNGDVGIDFPRVMARAHKVTETARGNVEAWLAGMDRMTVLRGHARFEGPDTLRVDGEVISAPRIFLNVGGRARVPEDMPGIGDIHYLTNTSILQLSEPPRHLAVVGGSYIGLEYAQMFRRFGCRVTVVERQSRLIAREDEDVSEALRNMLEAEGIAIRTDSECIAFAPHAEGAIVKVDCTSGDREVVASHVLLAVGRRPNTDDLGLEHAGVKTDEHGYIVVDDALATNVPGIWAMGDCNGRGAFTHTAYNDFEIIAANLLDGEQRRVSSRIPGYALFTDPPLGRIGMTDAQARASGKRLLMSKRPMTRVGRAVERGETQGFMKVVADADTRRILGAAILGVSGDEAIHGLIDLMSADQPFDALKWAVPIHPTVSELLPTLVGDLKPG